jgi:pyruvate/oxaloacetate carboxyltransferase
LSINTSLEAQNCALFKKGTSEAEVMTLAFWVKSTKTGTQIVNIYDAVNDREICQAYTIDATNTWEKKVLTYPGDTSGP